MLRFLRSPCIDSSLKLAENRLVSSENLTKLYGKAYRSLSPKGKQLLTYYFVGLILLAAIDALALIIVSTLVFQTNTTFSLVQNLNLSNELTIFLALFLFLSRSVFAVAINLLMVKRITSEQVRLGQANFKSIESLPWLQRKQFTQGDSYISIDHAPSDLFQRFLIPVVETAAEIMSICVIVTVLATTQPVTAFVGVFYFAAIALLQNIVLSKRIKSAGMEATKSLKGVADIIGDMFALSKVRQVQPSISLEGELQRRRSSRVIASARVSFLEQLPRNFMEVTLVMGVGVVSFSAYVTYGPQEIGSSLTLFATAAFRLLPSFNRIQASLLIVIASSAMVERALLDTPIKNSGDITKDIYLPRNSNADFLSNELKSGTSIEIENLFFSYPNTDKQVLKGISLTLEPGKQYAIVGKSGSGKTTLADLLLGLICPTSGTIRLLNSGKKTVLGYVPQSTFVFDGSFAENVALEWNDSAIDKERVRQALIGAALEDVVDVEKSDQISANTLSGGQMQRIGIARALYRNPTLIILDEATNSLDSETENQVIGVLERLRGSVTTILIAHSMKTIQNVDKVIFLEEGAVIGFDRFEKLRTDSKKFDYLVNSGELFIESD